MIIHIKCDDCGIEIIGTHIYFMGKNRCWKCVEIFHKKIKEKELGGKNERRI